ncbi:hypothetical protein [Allostreptomyces psammosilenae]|uniref:Scaffolding protein n=1 Tax=Allostreptomyces psammosilenae TaxID=1892865 RepID=A0A852ZWK7_9ACTN|nr:hypothetical protein [Allostreptomyces psammosilenae]NYI06067.1 hypothetical protein [Allostreptomyces psammosilenae]
MAFEFPVHPTTGEKALGFRKDGRPIWPIKGGSGDKVPATDPTADPSVDPSVDPEKGPDDAGNEPKDDPEADLGDAGKKALKAERDARKTAEKERDSLKEENARLRRANAAVKGTDLEAIKAEIRSEFEGRLAEAAIRAEAKGRLNDPSDTARYPEYFTDIDASDEGAVKSAIDKLLTDKPYLAASSDPKPWGDVGGGPRKSSEPQPTSPVERMARAYGRSR